MKTQNMEQKLEAHGKLLDERAEKALTFGIRCGGYVNLYDEKPTVWHKVEIVQCNKKLFGKYPVVTYANHDRSRTMFPKTVANLWDIRAYSAEMPTEGNVHTSHDIEYRYK